MQPTIHLQSKPHVDAENMQVCFVNVLWVALSIPSGSSQFCFGVNISS
jgi:hypothetical protein